MTSNQGVCTSRLVAIVSAYIFLCGIILYSGNNELLGSYILLASKVSKVTTHPT